MKNKRCFLSYIQIPKLLDLLICSSILKDSLILPEKWCNGCMVLVIFSLLVEYLLKILVHQR